MTRGVDEFDSANAIVNNNHLVQNNYLSHSPFVSLATNTMPPSPGPPTTYSTIAVPESAMVFIASHAARLPALAAVCALPSTDITVPLSEGVFGDIGRLLRLIDASPLQEDESVVVWAQTVQHHHLHRALVQHCLLFADDY